MTSPSPHPLLPPPPTPPPVRPRIARGAKVGWVARTVAATVAAACLGVLLLAASLHAEPAGHGTHQQLGLYPCGWVVAFDKPCPTCGMTTAFSHAADANFLSSLLVQPTGFLLALASAAVLWGALHIFLTGSRLASLGATMLRPRAVWAAVAFALLSWAYKVVTWSDAP